MGALQRRPGGSWPKFWFGGQCNSSYGFLVTVRITVSNFFNFSVTVTITVTDSVIKSCCQTFIMASLKSVF